MENQEQHSHFHIIPREILISRLLLNPFSDLVDFHFPIRRIFMRYVDEREDEEYKEENSQNPNFMKETNMKFRLYPLYINWKKIEHNEPGYYRILLRFGYFGAAIFSIFKEKYPSLDAKNILTIFAEFISENLVKKNNNNSLGDKDNDNKNGEIDKKVKEFFDKLPKIKDLIDLIENKIIMMKEVPLLILILKIYEIYYIINKYTNDIINVLKYEYLLLSYLSDEEYKDIYNNHFKGKISKIFKKLSETNGKLYIFPKTKVKFVNHIKSVYKSNNNIINN